MKEYSLIELEEKDLKELQKIAGQAGVEDEEIEQSNKHDLIFKVLEAQAKKSGLLFSEGVLETLEDGFGFLRAPEFSYLPSQDDIYVSPSQIRKFQLRTGDTISGIVRPPKNGEKYFALIKIEAINMTHPDVLQDMRRNVHFEHLTPALSLREVRPRGRQPEEHERPDHGPADAHRQGAERPDRVAAPGRQDDPAEDDRQVRSRRTTPSAS